MRKDRLSVSGSRYIPTKQHKVSFDSARQFGVQVHTDDQINELSPAAAADLALELTADRSHIHLSIELDALLLRMPQGSALPLQ